MPNQFGRPRQQRQFKARAENRQGGNWLYPCEYEGRLFQVHIDYGGRTAQLRYHLSFDDISAGIRARQLSYEGLLGLGHGEWDFVTADNLSESVLLLVELVQQLATIRVGIEFLRVQEAERQRLQRFIRGLRRK